MSFRTERDVARLALPEARADAFYFDALIRGLSVRLQGARRTWVVHYTSGGKRRRLTLGDVGGLSLSDARREAGRIVAGAKLGRDPLAAKIQARADAEGTLGKLAPIYLDARSKADPNARLKLLRKALRPKSMVEASRALLKYARPLHDRTVDAITERELDTLLEDLTVRSGPAAAGRTRAHLSTFWSWAVFKGHAAGAPGSALTGGYSAVSRDRVLHHAELAAIWQAAGELGSYGDVVKILALTGCRRAEVGGMRWDELDLEAGLWRIPADRMKNGQPHSVTLTPAAIAIIAGRERTGEFVFGIKGPLSHWSQGKTKLDALSGVSGWRLHDLRRTFATGLQQIGIRLEAAERCLAHSLTSGSRSGIVGIYQRHKWDGEAADAWGRWADRLLVIVGEQTNVVALRA